MRSERGPVIITMLLVGVALVAGEYWQKGRGPITTDSAFKFAGAYYDTNTKLYKMGQRYYDPNLGIWTQRDMLAGSLGDPRTMNRYTYAGADPVTSFDPSGNRSILGSTKNLAGSSSPELAKQALLANAFYDQCAAFVR